MTRAIALFFSLAFLMVLGAGCQATTPPPSLRYSAPFTCEPDIRESACEVCYKQRCCEPLRVCSTKKGSCPCSLKCLRENKGKPNQIKAACAAQCPDDDRAMVMCALDSCDPICQAETGGGTI
jgi:hypothetical protein